MIQMIKIIFMCSLSIINCSGHMVYTKRESENACAFAKSISVLSHSNYLQQTLMQTCPAVSFVSEMGGEGARLFFSQLSPFPYDTSSTENFAKSFTVEKYLPDGKKEVFNGLDFLKKCRTRNTEKLKYDRLICLIHGWQIKCSKHDVFANWGDVNAQYLADNWNAMVYVISWPACYNYFEIIHCYWRPITNLIANDFLIKGDENNQHPPLENSMYFGHSLGGQMVGHICRTITEQTGKICEFACSLDPAGPGFQTKYTRGECQGMHKNVTNRTIVVHSDPGGLGTHTNLCLGQVNIICKGLEKYPQSLTATLGYKHLFACNEFMYTFVRNISMNGTRVGDSSDKFVPITLYDEMIPGYYIFDSKYNPKMSRYEKTRPMRLFGSLVNSWL